MLCVNMVTAQQITVKDNVTRQPLQFVTLYSKALNVSAMTNVLGKADISQFKGADDILIRFVGYQQIEATYNELESGKLLVYLNPSEILLDEVVVSASRWRQEKRDVPNRVVAVPASEVALQNPQTAADLLSTSGKVYVQKSQLGGGSPMIRGFSTNRVLISVDGVRMNNAIFRSGNLQNVISVDPFSVDRTEIVFGPGSVIYGSDAIGGVMNFYTLNPVFSVNGKTFTKGSASVRYSTANEEKTGHFNFNIGLKKWAFATSVTYSDFGDLTMGSNGPDDYLRPEYVETINGVDSIVTNSDPEKQVPSGYNQINILQKVRFKPNENWDFNYGFQYSTTSDYSRYDRLLRKKKDGKLRSAEWYYGPQVWMMNNLNITNIKPTKLYDRLAIIAAHQYFEESRHDRDFRKPTRINRYEDVNVLSLNVDFEKKLTEKAKFYYGAELLLNSIGSTGDDENIETRVKEPAASRYPDGSTWNSYAIYGSYLNKISDKFSFQGGLRYNYVTLSSTFDTTYYPFPFSEADIKNGALTGSIGLTWKPASDLLISSNLSTGFRAPNIDDVGKVFDSQPGSVIVPNPDLKPEYAYNIDLGITKRFGKSLEIDLTAFYTRLDNALVVRDYTLNGDSIIEYDGEMSNVQAMQNAAQAWVWGASADVEANLPAGFGFHGDFTYQKGEEEVEDGSTAPLRHAAPYFGSAHVTWSRERLKADLYYIFNGKVAYKNLAPSEIDKDYLYAADADGKPYSPSWNTLNFKILYQVTDHFMVNLGVENITDQRYRPYSWGISAPRRNFIASVKYTF